MEKGGSDGFSRPAECGEAEEDKEEACRSAGKSEEMVAYSGRPDQGPKRSQTLTLGERGPDTMLDASKRNWGEDHMYCITITMTLRVYI